MGNYLRINKSNLDDLIKYGDQVSEKLINSVSMYSRMSTFSTSAYEAANKWEKESNNYWKKFYNEPSISSSAYSSYTDDTAKMSAWNRDCETAKSQAKQKLSEYVMNFRNQVPLVYNSDYTDRYAYEYASEKVKFANEKMEEAITWIKNIKSLIDNFESLATNGYLKLDKFFDATIQNYSLDSSISVTLDGGDTITVQQLVFTDEAGNTFNVSEMLNSFYTYSGMAAANFVSIASSENDTEAREAALTEMLGTVGGNVELVRGYHFFAPASVNDIKLMYEDITGDSFSALVGEETDYYSKVGLDLSLYSNVLTNEVGAANTDAMVMAGAVFGATGFTIAQVDPEDDDEDEEDFEPSSDGNKDKPEGGNTGETTGPGNEETNPGGKQPGEEDPSNGEEVPPEGGEDDEVPPGGGEEEEDPPGGGEEEEEPPKPEVPTPEEVEDVKTDIELIGKTEVPETPTETPLSREEIDDRARDEFYAETDVLEMRSQNLDDYKSMTEAEKVEALKELGYDDESANLLAQDDARGQLAYMLGKEEQVLTNKANELAAEEGITNHDTRFDDGHDAAYVMSGNANVDYAKPSPEVQAARDKVNTTRNNYEQAVETANKAIEKANEAKKRYTMVYENIIKTSGEDPSKWTKSQIDEYNKVADEYMAAHNTSVTAANNVTTTKTEYDKANESYEKAKADQRFDVLSNLDLFPNDDEGTGNGGVIMTTPVEGDGGLFGADSTSGNPEVPTQPGSNTGNPSSNVRFDENGKPIVDDVIMVDNVTYHE